MAENNKGHAERERERERGQILGSSGAQIKVDRIGQKEIENRGGVPVGLAGGAIEIKPR